MDYIKRRNNIAIIIDILETISARGGNKTQIVYSANLNFKRAERYLDLLHSMGLVAYSSEKYDITEQGREYLKKAKDINSIFTDLRL